MTEKLRSPKQNYINKSLYLPEEILDKVRERVSETKQTMTGFVQLAIKEKIERERA